MPARKQFQSNIAASDELKKKLQEAKSRPITEDDLQEQRVSFAFGNALQSERITKESVRFASKHLRLKQA